MQTRSAGWTSRKRGGVLDGTGSSRLKLRRRRDQGARRIHSGTKWLPMRARFLLVKKCVMNGVFSAMTPGSRRARGGLPRSRRWLKKPFWTAHERIAAFKKTKQLVGSPRDADAHGFADGTHGMVDFAKPKFFIPTKIDAVMRSEEHTSELQSPIDISYAVFCLKKKNQILICLSRCVLRRLIIPT